MITPAEAIAKALADGSAVETAKVNPAALFDNAGESAGESLGLTQSEYEFQEEIWKWAELHGWFVMGVRPVRVQRANGDVYYQTPFFAHGKGWPDLTLVRGSEIVFCEVKTAKGRTSAEQDAWLDRLQRTGAAAGVCSPNEWPRFKKKLAEAAT